MNSNPHYENFIALITELHLNQNNKLLARILIGRSTDDDVRNIIRKKKGTRLITPRDINYLVLFRALKSRGMVIEALQVTSEGVYHDIDSAFPIDS